MLMKEEFFETREEQKYERGAFEEVGSLHVLVEDGKEFSGKGMTATQETFIRTRLEGTEFNSTPLTGFRPGFSDSKHEFPVTDVSANLYVQVWRKTKEKLNHKPQPSDLIGQLVIPLPSLLPSSLLSKQPVSKEGWFQLYPLSTKATKYVTCLDEGTGTAMDRPSAGLGQLKVKVTLTLTASPFKCYTESSRFSVDHMTKVMDNKVIDWYITRMKRLVKIRGGFVAVMQDLIDWKHPGASVLAIVLVSYTCLYAGVWMYPFLFASVLAVLGYTSSGRSSEREETSGRLNYKFKDEVPKDSETLMGKARKFKQTLGEIQFELGRVVMYGEKIGNLLNWDLDPRVAAMTTIALLATSLVLSVKLFFFSVFLDLTGLHMGVFVWLGLLALMTPPNARDALLESLNKNKTKSEGVPPVASTSTSTTLAVPAPTDTSSSASPVNEDHFDRVQRLLWNFISRVPDYTDEVHRSIARSQLLADEGPARWTSGEEKKSNTTNTPAVAVTSSEAKAAPATKVAAPATKVAAVAPAADPSAVKPAVTPSVSTSVTSSPKPKLMDEKEEAAIVSQLATAKELNVATGAEQEEEEDMEF